VTKRRTVAALGASAVLAGLPAAAHAEAPNKHLKHEYQHLYKAAEHKGADPGRNIVADGVHRHHRTRPAKAHEVRKSIGVLQRMIAPPPAPVATTATTTSTGSTASGSLAAIAACESGGNPGAVDASGTYRGKYQFDQRTWESVGGTGDPAAAPESVQDQKAAELMAQRGTSPWPVCG
jgi:hypothetical protein